MDKKKNIVIPFRLEDMKTTQWAVFSENFSQEEETEIDFRFVFGVNAKERLVRCVPKISLLQNGKKYLVLEVVFIYSIKEDAWHDMITENSITIPKLLKEHLLMIAVGTMRGVLYEKTLNNKFGIDKFVLQTLNVRNGTGDDLVFDLSQSDEEE